MRIFLFIFLSLVLSTAPLAASAATADFFGPIISPACTCQTSEVSGAPSAPDFGCVFDTLQRTINFGIALAVIIVTLVIAYAGILWVTSPMNAENREQGRTILLNAIIGLVITLSAWLIVDFVLKFLYNESANAHGIESLGPWNAILDPANARECLRVQEPPQPVAPAPTTPGEPVVVAPGPTTPTPTTPTPTPTNPTTTTPTTPTTPTALVGGSCTSSAATAVVNTSITWTATAPTGGTGMYTYAWTGTDTLSGTTRVLAKVYTTAGSKSASVTVTSGTERKTIACSRAVTITAAPPPAANADGQFTYDPGIQRQMVHASPRLRTFLACVASRVPANVGRISSISDSNIISGRRTFPECAAAGHRLCNHTNNSCHYGGGGSCNGQSYAVDFGDEQNMRYLRPAAQACGANFVLNEGNHLHASVGASCNCR